MDFLAIIHGGSVRSGVFGDVVRERGHVLEEWSLAWDEPLPRPLDAYGAVLVFGGAMHADQDDHHPWLREEDLFLQRLLDLHMPVLGICLGAQLLAKAAHAPVFPAEEAEVGWFAVELTEAGTEDPVLGRLPPTFDAFQWHYYAHDVPAGAVELARNRVCTQAFRLGVVYAGVKGHPCQALARRLLRHQGELFEFVRVPGLDADNNRAERLLRPLVIGRKISGGTRSPAGTAAHMGLSSLFATWQARRLNPFHACLSLLHSRLPQT